MENKKSNSGIFFGLATLFLIINTVGLLALISYQILIKTLPYALPTIPLLSGLSLWWLLVLIVYVPIIFLIALNHQLNIMFEDKKIEETNKLLKSMNQQQVPQEKVSYDWVKKTDDTFKH